MNRSFSLKVPLIAFAISFVALNVFFMFIEVRSGLAYFLSAVISIAIVVAVSIALSLAGKRDEFEE